MQTPQSCKLQLGFKPGSDTANHLMAVPHEAARRERSSKTQSRTEQALMATATTVIRKTKPEKKCPGGDGCRTA